MMRSLWILSKYLSYFKVEYEDASLLIPFLKDQRSALTQDVIGVDDEGDETSDMGVPVVVRDL